MGAGCPLAAAKTNHTPASRAHQHGQWGLGPEAKPTCWPQILALSPVTTFHSPGILKEPCSHLAFATHLPFWQLSLSQGFLITHHQFLGLFSPHSPNLNMHSLPETHILEDCLPNAPSLCWVHTHCLHLVSMELPPGEGLTASARQGSHCLSPSTTLGPYTHLFLSILAASEPLLRPSSLGRSVPHSTDQVSGLHCCSPHLSPPYNLSSASSLQVQPAHIP